MTGFLTGEALNDDGVPHGLFERFGLPVSLPR